MSKYDQNTLVLPIVVTMSSILRKTIANSLKLSFNRVGYKLATLYCSPLYIANAIGHLEDSGRHLLDGAANVA